MNKSTINIIFSLLLTCIVVAGISAATKSKDTPLAKKTLSEDYENCNDCHEDQEPNPTRRILEDDHDTIVLKHGPKTRWCLDCHNLADRMKLTLVGGKTVSINESSKLCGQCHGKKLAESMKGIHGKRVGKWNGPRTYYRCVNCHNPHSPAFKKLKPLPPPVRQEDIK